MKNYKEVKESLNEEQKKFLNFQRATYGALGFSIGLTFMFIASAITLLKHKPRN